MIDKLFIDLFEKIDREEGANNKNAASVFFVNTILEDYGKSRYISEKKTSRYYEKYIEKKSNVSVKSPDETLKEIISKYLGYKNYRDFIVNYDNRELENKIIPSDTKTNFNDNEKDLEKKNKSNNFIKITSVILIPIIGFFGINYFSTNYNCIIWKGNKFQKSYCGSINSINNSTYNIDIDNFKKINITKETVFFQNGKPIIWYGKSAKGKIDFFTQRGIHPETLKELKPITEFIINKYVFTNKKDKTILE